ncbi:hypothetical protein [Clostridium sp.]|uniref:hypothetical protein n=1 Tax=Clostridium sp. TaxID=1506 RepID=UPI0035A18E67
MFLKVDTGTLSIPMFNLQCMIDGRNLQGGLNSDPPHAECFEKQSFVNMNGLYLSKVKSNYIETEIQNPITSILSVNQTADIAAISSGKQMSINYALSIKKYGEILYLTSQYKDKYLMDEEILIIDNEGLYFKTVYEGTAVNEVIDSGKLYSFELLDSSNFSSIESLEVK